MVIHEIFRLLFTVKNLFDMTRELPEVLKSLRGYFPKQERKWEGGANGALRPPAFENFVYFGRQTRKNRVFMGILRSTLYKKRHYAPLLLKFGDTRGSNSATPPLP